MPRLSLYRPEKSKDYKFIDRTIYEAFQVGGVDVHVHKYIGPVDPSDPSKALGETTIQDVVFLENRDRKYDTDVYTIRGHYQVQDIDFNLSQFGLFLQNDTVYMTIHINNSVDLVGRKMMSGDVLELPNLAEEYTFDPRDPTNFQRAIKKFYVVEDVNRAAEGFSATWYPHLYRLKLKPIVDSQEFKDILERPADNDVWAGVYEEGKTYYPGQVVRWQGQLYVVKDSVGAAGTNITPPDTSAWDSYTKNSLQDILSTFEKEMQINSAIIAEAESDAALSGYETSHLYTLAVNETTGNTEIVQSSAGAEVATPTRDGYQGYLLDDGIPPNGDLPTGNNQFGFGIQFPPAPISGDTFLRTDYLPNRLFRFNGSRWIRQEDNVRMTLTNNDTRQTQKTSFINNTELSGINRLASDVLLIEIDGSVQYESTDVTASFELLPTGAYVVVNLAYNSNYTVEAWLDESSKVMNITTSNANGSFAFTINDSINAGTRIRYSVFEHAVVQRQAVSKALRKFKPTADN